MWQLEIQFFCHVLYLTGVHFRGELQHGGDVSQQKIKYRPIRTGEMGGVSLPDVLYVRHNFASTVNPLRSCYLEVESAQYYIIRCHNYTNFRNILMNELKSINSKSNTLELDELICTILYADKILIMTPILRSISSNKLNDLSQLFIELTKFVFMI